MEFSDYTFSKITEEVLKDFGPFDCGNPDLNDFFNNDCLLFQEQLLGKSYCFIDTKINQIACAFTIANDSIKSGYLTNSKKKKLTKLIPSEKRFRSYPAVLIGRLGVNANFNRSGLGSQVMNFIKSWFIDSQNKTGCRFLVVDAYNTQQALQYYEKNSFQFLFSNEVDESSYLKLKEGQYLNTRLMYFDLITLKG